MGNVGSRRLGILILFLDILVVQLVLLKKYQYPDSSLTNGLKQYNIFDIYSTNKAKQCIYINCHSITISLTIFLSHRGCWYEIKNIKTNDNRIRIQSVYCYAATAVSLVSVFFPPLPIPRPPLPR
jgi:hypothetical protein